MNYFMKEELECLHNAIDIQVKTIAMSEINASRRRDIIEKLQSMIDDYCDHEKSKIDYDYQPLRCNNCKEIIE